MGTIENETRRKVNALNPELETKTKAVERAKSVLDRAKQDIEDLKREISVSESEIEKANAFINGQESVVEDNRKYLGNQDQIRHLEDEKKEIQKERQKFVRKYMVLLSLYNVNKRTGEYIAERESSDSLKTNINVEAIEDSLEHHECRLCTQGIPHDIEEDLRRMVQRYKANASLQLLSRIGNDINRALDIFDYEKQKQGLFDKLNKCEDDIQELEAENEKLAVRIKRASDVEEIDAHIESRKYHEGLLEDNKYKKRRLEEQLPGLEKAYSDSQRELENAMNDDEESRHQKARLRFIGSALKYSDIIQTEIVKGIKEKMEKDAMDLFLQLR